MRTGYFVIHTCTMSCTFHKTSSIRSDSVLHAIVLVSNDSPTPTGASNESHHLAVAIYSDSRFLNTNSLIFVTNNTVFDVSQSIVTDGAYDWESFTIEGQTFVAVANFGSMNQNIKSEILKWNASASQFQHFQYLATHAGALFVAFMMDSDHYIAIANAGGGSSEIFKWTTSQEFESFQKVTTKGCRGLVHFVIDSINYLAFADGNITNIYTYSNGSQFVLHQNLQTPAIDVDFFTLETEIFLMVTFQSPNIYPTIFK